MKSLRVVGLLMAAMGLLFSTTASAQVPEEAQAWLNRLETVEGRELSEREMTSLIAAMKEIEAMEDESINTDSPNMFSAIAANDAARGAIEKQGFTPESFESVVNNLVLAMGALAMEGQKAEIEQAMAQLEAMKGQLPEAQYQMLEKQVMGTVKLFQRAPESNVRLVEKYQSELEAIGQ